MGLDLTLYIEKFEGSICNFSELLTERNYQFYDKLLKIEQKINTKVRKRDKYGKRLKYITVKEFKGCDFFSLIRVNAAAIAYINCLPDNTKIYLYWH